MMFLVILPEGLLAQQPGDGKVVVSVAGKKDVEKVGRQMCEVSFTIQNNAFGTINGLEVPVTAQNDRGRTVKNFGVPQIRNIVRFKAEPIARGETLSRAKGATFEEECKYLKTIEIDQKRVNETSCNIRMMPEGVSCRDVVLVLKDGESVAAATAAAENAKTAGPQYLDVGHVIVNGRKMDFLDYASEDPYSMVGKDIEIVGYVMRFSEWERHKVWGYRFDVKVYGGEEGQSYAKMGEPYLDVIVAPSKTKNYGSDLVGTLANLRKVNFKMLTKSDRGAALVRFKGKSNIYSNTGDLYMMTESMEVIAYKD